MQDDDNIDYPKIVNESFNEGVITSFKFPNIGYLMTKLPDDMYEFLWSECEKIKNDFSGHESQKHNMNLRGHIKKEYKILECVEHIEDFVVPIAVDYAKKCKLVPTILNRDLPSYINGLWVNFQKKHEFNPPHIHTGFVSFVIWMKIPYDIKEENAFFEVIDRDAETSKFGFIYTNTLGQTTNVTIPVDKSYEGFICFFPSGLMHYVNPFFTSDEYRVSISGNVALRA